MKSTRTVLSILISMVLLTIPAIMSACAYDTEVLSDTGKYGLMDSCQDGVILHAWNWSYNTVSENLEAIAEAGYTSVQVSPVQESKDYLPKWNEVSTQWWKLYQPISFNFADGTTWLGTKEDFKSMCSNAHNYGIKIIVDIVSNHLANNGTETGNSADNRSTDIPENIRSNDAYWHTNKLTASDKSRCEMVLGSIGLPDLNTSNKDVQQMVIDLMKECVDMGADGFRFDAAKHIETPGDSSLFKSDFWPNVTNAVQEYSDKEIYFYAELLFPINTKPENYAKYMSVTDDVTSYWSRTYVTEQNSYGASASDYNLNVGADKTVLWVESHDNYIDGTTSDLTNNEIKQTWAIVASRANASALFLARPDETTVMGEAGNDNWKSAEVTAINKFHNAFNGKSEYLSCSGSFVLNERGNSGVVISNLGSSAELNVKVNRLEDGTYLDAVSGDEFTVCNGKLSGHMDDGAVAVLYMQEQNNNTYVLFDNSAYNWEQVYCYIYNAFYWYNDEKTDWPGELMQKNSDGVYFLEIDSDYKNGYVVFSSGNGEQTPKPFQMGYALNGKTCIYEGGEFWSYSGNVNTELLTADRPSKALANKLGDITADGNVNMMDVVVMQKITAGLVALNHANIADINGDGRFNMQDITCLQRTIAGVL